MKPSCAIFFLLLLLCLSASAQPTNGQLNTGTNGSGGTLPVGANDLNWQVALNTMTGPYVPAVVMTPPSNYYLSPWPNADWVSYVSDGAHNNSLEIFFKTSFNLPPCGSQTGTRSFCLALDFFADNCVFEIYVNGVPQSGPTTFLPPAGNPYLHWGFQAGNNVSVNLCNNWQVGTNDLIVHVKSDPGYVGFLAQTSVSIVQPPPPSLTLSVAAPGLLTCSSPSVTLTASSTTPGVLYNWETGSTTNTTTITTPGYYTVTIYDTINGCESTVDSVYVGQNIKPPDVQIAPPDTLTCNVTSVQLSASSLAANVIHVWNTNDTASILNVNATGYYRVVACDTINGCQAVDSVYVDHNVALPDVRILPYGQWGCLDTSMTLTASSLTPNVIHVWNTGDTASTITILSPVTYSVTAVDTVNGCTAAYDAIVTSVIPPTASFIPPTGQCINGNSFAFTASGTNLVNPTYSWTFAHGTPPTSMLQNPTGIAFSTTGTCEVTLVITDNGCVSSHIDSITVFAMPFADFTVDTTTGCGNLTVNFTPTSPQSVTAWAWDFGDGGNSSQQNPSYTFSTAGTYSVSLTTTTAEGCPATSIQANVVTVIQVPIADFIPDKLIDTLPNAAFSFTNESQYATTYLWTFGNENSTDTNLTHHYTAAGEHAITLRADNGECTDEITKTIIVVEKQAAVHIPTAFSPNGDGKNDFFRVILENAELERLTIFNRWGEVVFQTNNINEYWDGTYLGGEQPMGVFAYTATVRFPNSKETYTGNVTLVK